MPGYQTRYSGAGVAPHSGFGASGYWGLPAGTNVGTATATTLNALTMCMYQFPASAGNIDRLGIWITAGGGASSVVRLGAWAVDGSGAPTTLLVDGGTVDGNAIGFASVTVDIPRPSNGLVLLGCCPQGSGTPSIVRVDSGTVPAHLVPAGGFSAGQFSPSFRMWLVSGTSGAFASNPSVGSRVPGTNLVSVAPAVLARHA